MSLAPPPPRSAIVAPRVSILNVPPSLVPLPLTCMHAALDPFPGLRREGPLPLTLDLGRSFEPRRLLDPLPVPGPWARAYPTLVLPRPKFPTVDLDGGDSVRSRFSKDYDMYRGVLVYAICSCKE